MLAESQKLPLPPVKLPTLVIGNFTHWTTLFIALAEPCFSCTFQISTCSEISWKMILMTFSIYAPLEMVVKIMTKFDVWIYTGMIVFYFCASFKGD